MFERLKAKAKDKGEGEQRKIKTPLFNLQPSTFNLAIAIAIATIGPLFALEIDGVAARVGTETILKSDVVKELRHAKLDQEHYQRVLDEMVERKLIVKAAELAKMTLPEWTVESRIREIIQKGFGGNRNKLMEALARDQVSYTEWYARMKEDMVISAMRYQVVDKNISASPAELLREYKLHPERYEDEAKVQVSSILLKPDDAKFKDEISAALKGDPKKFSELAIKYSADVQAKNGGVWKDVAPKDAFRSEVCEVIAGLKPGETSKWLEFDGWNYLIRKDSDTPVKHLSFEDAYDRISENVKEEMAKVLYTEWIKRLKAEIYVKVF